MTQDILNNAGVPECVKSRVYLDRTKLEEKAKNETPDARVELAAFG